MENVQGSSDDASENVQSAAAAGTIRITDLMGNALFDEYGPGIHLDVPAEKYYAIPAISASSLKAARKSFRHFEYYVTGGEYDDTPAMEFGRLAHLCLLEHDRFKRECMFTDFEDKRASGWKKAVKDNPGKTLLTRKVWTTLTEMFEELLRNEACMKIIKDVRTEVTLLAKDPITGFCLKGRVDFESCTEPFIGDYKTCEDAKPTEIPEEMDATKSLRSSKFERRSNELGYENQAAFYLFLGELLKANWTYFAVVAQEKKRPFVPCPYVYGFETVEEAARENRELLNRLKDAYLTGKFPGYADKPVVLARPSYARS